MLGKKLGAKEMSFLKSRKKAGYSLNLHMLDIKMKHFYSSTRISGLLRNSAKNIFGNIEFTSCTTGGSYRTLYRQKHTMQQRQLHLVVQQFKGP